ncbi:hypothetical protein QEN19_001551 [Hanseniaspora menglaensis]
MRTGTILFDREEADLSKKHDTKRYEDIFNCRVILLGFTNEHTKERYKKFLNMDYPILHVNLKRQMINKKIKLEKKIVRLNRQQSTPSVQSEFRKKSFLKQNSSPLSALENVIKEEHIDKAFESPSYYDYSAIDSDSSESFILDEEEEGEDMHYFTTARSHRLSMNYSEELAHTDSIEEPLNTHLNPTLPSPIGGNHYYKHKTFEEVQSFQFDFQNFQPAQNYKEYKDNIIKNTISSNKPCKYLVDEADSFDKAVLLEASLDDMKVNYSKYPHFENQALNFHLLEMKQDDFLDQSLTNVQKLQISQTDAFVFQLQDCSQVMDNQYSDFDQSEGIDKILSELEQLLPTLYENLDPTSQNLETPFLFTCCSCDDHKDNGTSIDNGMIKKLNPKLLKFFTDLGINYQTSFFPVSMNGTSIENTIRLNEQNDQLLENNMGKTDYLNNSIATKSPEHSSFITATVNHDTGRLLVASVEETLFFAARKVVSSKLDMYYQVEKKNGRLTTHTSHGNSSTTNNTESSFFVSKDVREASNRTPPIHSPSFINTSYLNASSLRQEIDSLTTPATENFTVFSQSPAANLSMVNNSQKIQSKNLSPVLQRTILKSNTTAALQNSNENQDSSELIASNVPHDRSVIVSNLAIVNNNNDSNSVSLELSQNIKVYNNDQLNSSNDQAEIRNEKFLKVDEVDENAKTNNNKNLIVKAPVSKNKKKDANVFFLDLENFLNSLCVKKPETETPKQRHSPHRALYNMVLVQDLLHPSAASESRKHKLKTLVQGPRSYFIDVKCPGCLNITTIFSHAQTAVACESCNKVLCQPTGGKAKLTEGTSFRRK